VLPRGEHLVTPKDKTAVPVMQVAMSLIEDLLASKKSYGWGVTRR
jgi:hypothetical protein